MGFASQITLWQRQYGRHELPWQEQRDPYRVWLSEIMLQQTQVTAVIPYYKIFLERFPSLLSLANASLDDVLVYWSGLGYYARARNLHGAARLIADQHKGKFPRRYDEVCNLSGIGKSTAAAICVFAFGQRHAILDGNVKRVLARYFGISGYPGDKKIEVLLWKKSKRLVPAQDVEAYTQGLMDLGATLCIRSKPRCELCPIKRNCIAHRTDRVATLPTPKPKKTLVLKHTTMWVLLHQHEVLLEKRAPLGIWGGLWSFPEVQADQDTRAHCECEYGVEIGSIVSLPEYEHRFTNFKLLITPKLIHAKSRRPRAEQSGKIWLSIEDALGAAIPVPVRKILSQLEIGFA